MSTDPEKASASVSSEKVHASVEADETAGSTSPTDENRHLKGSAEVYNAHIDVSGVDERKLLRKMDLYLVPWLSFLYLLSFLDRTSIGNAKVRIGKTLIILGSCLTTFLLILVVRVGGRLAHKRSTILDCSYNLLLFVRDF